MLMANFTLVDTKTSHRRHRAAEEKQKWLRLIRGDEWRSSNL